MRTQSEVEEKMHDAIEQGENGTKFSGMTYEQGVEYALRWVLDEQAECPLAD